MNRIGVIFLSSLALMACSKDQVVTSSNDTNSTRSITIMTFNVENLFDAQDDEGKDDHAYLPRAVKDDPDHIAKCEPIEVERWRRDCLELDWNEAAVTFKLGQLANVIATVNDGAGPDIIAFQEIENAGILNRLSSEYLPSAGYGDAILIEGRDQRGIDVAFLSKLPLAEPPSLHNFDASAFSERADDTRGILQATFVLPGGGLLTGFSVHFPAPYHPIGMRELAYDHLNKLRRQLDPDRFVFAAGDFNTPVREMTETSIMDDKARPFWTIAHEEGCPGCKGTNYWARGDSWSFLDMIFFSPAKSARSQWRIQPGSVVIVDDYRDQLRADGTPKRFNLAAREGVSDHLPMLITLESVQ